MVLMIHSLTNLYTEAKDAEVTLVTIDANQISADARAKPARISQVISLLWTEHRTGTRTERNGDGRFPSCLMPISRENVDAHVNSYLVSASSSSMETVRLPF